MKNLLRLVLGVTSVALFLVGAALAQTSTATNHAFAIGKGPGVTGFASLLCATTQLPIGQTSADPICRTVTGDVTINASGVTAIGAGKVTNTMIAGMTSAQLAAILSDETGSGAAYFVGGALGTPASGVLTNATGLPLAGLATQGAYTLVGNATGSTAVPTAVDIAALTTKASPASTDYIVISDQASSGALKKATVSSVGTASGISSLGGVTGAVTLSTDLDISGSVLGLKNPPRGFRAHFGGSSMVYEQKATSALPNDYIIVNASTRAFNQGSYYAQGGPYNFYRFTPPTGTKLVQISGNGYISAGAKATQPAVFGFKVIKNATTDAAGYQCVGVTGSGVGNCARSGSEADICFADATFGSVANTTSGGTFACYDEPAAGDYYNLFAYADSAGGADCGAGCYVTVDGNPAHTQWGIAILD